MPSYHFTHFADLLQGAARLADADLARGPQRHQQGGVAQVSSVDAPVDGDRRLFAGDVRPTRFAAVVVARAERRERPQGASRLAVPGLGRQGHELRRRPQGTSGLQVAPFA